VDANCRNVNTGMLYGSVLSFDLSNSGRLAHQSDIEAELLWIEIKGVAVGGSNSSSDYPGACCRGNLSVKRRGALCAPAECKTKHSRAKSAWCRLRSVAEGLVRL
jgi:hypothetical protein